jgi:uncharacterized protein (DUF934 family)
MRLIRDRRPWGSTEPPSYAIEDDAMIAITELDGEPAAIAPDADVIVGWARWERERETLSAHRGRLGVRIASDADVDAVARDAARFATIAIEFPKFTDGRGYSIARLLRDRHRYAGELRAVGNVLRDQLAFMARCGLTAFEVDPSKDLEKMLGAFDDFTVHYQPAADQPLPLWKRHARPRPRPT